MKRGNDRTVVLFLTGLLRSLTMSDSTHAVLEIQQMRFTILFALGLSTICSVTFSEGTLGQAPSDVAVASAEPSKEKAIERDRKRIAGRWQVTSIIANGKKLGPDESEQLTVINGTDGSWTLRRGEELISRGTSSFDPTVKPKQIDFTPTEGESAGKPFHGIYRLGKNQRKMCFTQADNPRPEKFKSEAGSNQVLVEFKRIEQE